MKKKRVHTISRFFPFISNELSSVIDTLKLNFNDDGDMPIETPREDHVGFNHGHFVPEMLSSYMLDELKKTGGMICIPTICVTKSLVEKYHDHGISVAVFSVKSRMEIKELERRANPDLYYVDNVAIFTNDL